MHNAIAAFLISAVLTVTGGAVASAAEAETPETAAVEPVRTEIIKSIEFEGNEHFKDHVLRERLGFKLGDRLDPFLAEGGRLTIAEVYRKIGYVSVEVQLDRDRMERGNLFYRINEGSRVQIDEIYFVGNEAMSSRTLHRVIKTAEQKWLLWPYYYTEEAIERDLDRLREFYYDHGYLDYKIEGETEFSSDGSGVVVTFEIEEGPLYRIGDIVLSNNTHFTDEQLRGQMTISEGQTYLKPTAAADAKTLTKSYRQIGFVDAEVRHRVRFAPQAGDYLVTIEFEVDEGERFRIGRIEITGNESTQDKTVRRVLDEYEFTPGNWYDASLAPKEGGGRLESHTRYAAVAQEVLIRPVDPPDGTPGRKDVQVDIKEGPSGSIMPGVGISSDSGFIGRLVYQQQNFDITDLPDNPMDIFRPWKAFKGAGQVLKVTLEPGTRYSQYYVNFSDPYWRDRPITMDLLGRSWKRYRESHDEQRGKGYIGFEQRLKRRWRRSIGFRAENVEVDDLDSDAPLEIRDVEGYTMLFGVKGGLGLSDVDDRYFPAKGHVIRANYEQVMGDYTFGILEGSYTRYFTLHEDIMGRKTVLATKVLAATVLGDAPPFEKFYAGGSGPYGIRGFEYRGVSTRGLQTNVADPRYKDPIGSDWIFLANTELTVPIIEDNFAALFFVDSGTVDTGHYRVSIGTGIQVMVPQLLGRTPMRFEIATPLVDDDEDETQIFSFSAGGMF